MDTPIGCSTFVFRSLGALEALETIARHGFRRADLCIVPGACPHFDLESFDRGEIDRLRRALSSLGITLSSLNVIAGFFNLRNADQVLQLTLRAVDLAHELGVPVLTVPCGARVDPARWALSVRSMRPRFAALSDHAERRGVALSVEIPHKGTLGATTEDAIRFFSELNDPRLRCTFDSSHILAGGEPSLVAGVRALGPALINHVHLRDSIGANIQVTPGRGRGDFSQLFDELRAAGYSGNFTLELELRSAGTATMERELRFAQGFIERAASGRAPTLSEQLAVHPAVSFAQRLLLNPIEEIKRSPRLKHAVIDLAAHASSLIPMRTYDGAWRPRVHFPKRFIRGRAGSCALERTTAEPVRVCIAGSGYAGVIHAYGFRRLRGVQVVGVSDLDAAKAQRLARLVGCTPYASTLEMIEKERPRIVSIATGEWQHHEIARACLERDIDLYCEKSLSSSIDEARELVELARGRGRVFGMAYNYRFFPAVRRLKQLIDQRRAGSLVMADIRVHGAACHHILDLVGHLAGDPTWVHATYVNQDSLRPFGAADWRLWDPDILYVPSRSFAALFRTSLGADVAVTSSFLHDPRSFIFAMDLTFERGAIALTGIHLDDIVGRLSGTGAAACALPPAPAGRPALARGFELSFYAAIESFMNAYVAGRRPETPVETGLSLMNLERAIAHSNAAGQRVFAPQGGW